MTAPSSTIPEPPAARKQRRYRSGVRTWLICSGILAGAALLYIFVYQISMQAAIRRWSRQINQALSLRDVALTAQLLQNCRREFPQMSSRRQFLLWQEQLLELQRANLRQQQQFRQSFRNLQQLVDRNPEQINLNVELAKAARYASNPEELALLRTLQQQCELLTINQTLNHSRQTAAAGKLILRNLSELSELRKKQNFADYNKLYQQTQTALNELLKKPISVPELSARNQELQQKLQAERTAGEAAQAAVQIQENDFQKILTSNTPAEIIRLSQIFLQKYPHAPAGKMLRQLIKDLQILQTPFQQELTQQLELASKRSDKALQEWQNNLEKIINRTLNGTIFELILQISPASAEDKNDLIKRFETWEKCAFSAPDKHGVIHIKFTDTSGQSVSGAFQTDGEGTVTTPAGSWQGKLKFTAPRGELPMAFWQQQLYTMRAYTLDGNATEFPQFVLHWQSKIPDLRNYLPANLYEQLSAALHQADQTLQGAEQFIFDRKLLQISSEHTPVFAGLLYCPSGQNPRFFPAAASQDIRTLWLIDSRREKPFINAGLLHGNQLELLKSLKLDKDLIYAAAGPAKSMNWQTELQKLQQKASKQKLQINKLPLFLQFN